MAEKLLDNAEKANKTVTPGNIAYYTILHMKSGRRSCSSSNSDVLGTGTQLNGRSTVNSLEEIVAEDEGNEIFQIHDVLSIDKEDPAMKAARKLDWDEFLGSLTKRQRLLVESMLAGKNRVQAARSIGVSTWTINYDRTRLAEKIVKFMGADILVEILRIPVGGTTSMLNVNCWPVNMIAGIEVTA